MCFHNLFTIFHKGEIILSTKQVRNRTGKEAAGRGSCLVKIYSSIQKSSCFVINDLEIKWREKNIYIKKFTMHLIPLILCTCINNDTNP